MGASLPCNGRDVPSFLSNPVEHPFPERGMRFSGCNCQRKQRSDHAVFCNYSLQFLRALELALEGARVLSIEGIDGMRRRQIPDRFVCRVAHRASSE